MFRCKLSFNYIPKTFFFIRKQFIRTLRLGVPKYNESTARNCSASDENFHRHSTTHILFEANSDEVVNRPQYSFLCFYKLPVQCLRKCILHVVSQMFATTHLK